MNIKDITGPEFLKNLDAEQCQQVADEIRSYIIETVSKTGGHLASSLGVVELTVALHKVFDSPKDKILFDVGHQCYAHKILTGRAKDFGTLRQYGGISGFEKRCESVHDVWEAGHSSTSLSAALGMAVARDLNHERYHIVPVIGDASLESGMALEALNQIGDEKRRMIIVFNDNEMSISRNVGYMTKAFARLRISAGYNEMKHDMKESLSRNKGGTALYHGLSNIRDYVKSRVIDAGIFDDFGLDYLGPIDGYNMNDLIHVLETAKEKSRPVIVHVITQKGHGYPYAEKDTEGIWHGVGPFDPKTGQMEHHHIPGYEAWSAVLSDTLEQMAKDNRDIVAITPAMKLGSKLNHFFAMYPDRSFDTGIAEEHAATFAAGLAISGKRPYLCIYSTFLQRAYDQVNHDICRMDLPVVIGIDRAGLVGADGPTHHGVFDIGMLRAMPNIILSQPKDATEAQQLMRLAFSQKHPFAIRYPRGQTAYQKGTMAKGDIRVGSWEVFGPLQKDVPVLCAYGPRVIEALERKQREHANITIINCRFFKPLDESVMKKLTDIGMPVYIDETDMKAEGLGSAMMEWADDHEKPFVPVRFGIGDQYVTQGPVERLEKDLGIDLDTVWNRIVTDYNKVSGQS